LGELFELGVRELGAIGSITIAVQELAPRELADVLLEYKMVLIKGKGRV
jgi:hypothetical protein